MIYRALYSVGIAYRLTGLRWIGIYGDQSSGMRVIECVVLIACSMMLLIALASRMIS